MNEGDEENLRTRREEEQGDIYGQFKWPLKAGHTLREE